MVYVMLSRVCSIEQLIIVEKMVAGKIKVNEFVRAEVARMEKVSVNKNPCRWMDTAAKGLKVCSLNTRSLRKHMEDVRSDPVLLKSDILCVQETWLKNEEEKDDRYQLEGFRATFASVGHGKGLAVYVKEGVKYESMTCIPEANIQMMKITMAKLDIITVYRSDSEPEYRAAHHLSQLIDPEKDTLVVGDLNYCDKMEKKDLSRFLAREGFTQLVTVPTHIRGGVLDHAHLRRTVSKPKVEVKTFSHYYTDHDSVTCVL